MDDPNDCQPHVPAPLVALGKLCAYLFVGAVLIGAAGLWLVGCPGDRSRAKTIVENQGFTNVEVGGPARYDCGDEYASNLFTATSPTGHQVHGVVCCGVVAKGCTVRWP